MSLSEVMSIAGDENQRTMIHFNCSLGQSQEQGPKSLKMLSMGL